MAHLPLAWALEIFIGASWPPKVLGWLKWGAAGAAVLVEEDDLFAEKLTMGFLPL